MPAFTNAKGCKIFFSSIPDGEYYHYDSGLREQLEKSLSGLRRLELITIWHDGKLSGGMIREQEMRDHLEAAEIIVLLLSSDFLDSDFCYDQMQDAMQRHERGEALVIPVFMRPIIDGWEDLPFGKLAPLPMGELFYASEPNKKPEWCYKVAKDLRDLVLHALVLPPGDPVYAQARAYREALLSSPSSLFPASLVQRTKQVEEIHHRLTQDTHTALILTGLGGSGKSALATQVYAFIEKQQQTGQGSFADKPLWFSIDKTITPLDVLSSLCYILGRPLPLYKDLAENNLAAKELANELFQSIKNTARLIVLDQLETWLDPQSGMARPEHQMVNEWLNLLNTFPQACAGRVLLTSRFYPHGVLSHSEQVQEYSISGMERSESIQLLRMGNIPAIKQATDKALSTLAQRCQGHAQTLAWLHELFKRDPSLTLSDLLHQPSYENWWTGPKTFELLNAIYTQYLNQEQRELLLAFSVYREAVPFEAALAIVEPTHKHTRRWSADVQLVLLNLGLLQAPGNGLYRIHPIAADFVHTYFEKQNDRERWVEVHNRAARYYHNLFQDAFFLEEFDALLALTEATWHLCQAEQYEQAYRLIQETKLFTTLHRLGRNSLLLNLYVQLLAQKHWLHDLPLEARLHHEMGEIRSALGQTVEALQEYRHALHLFRQAEQLDGVVEALNNIGAMYRWLKRYSEAQACYQEALHICEEAPTSIAQKGTTFNNLGRLAFEQGKLQKRKSQQRDLYYHEALNYYEQALAWYQENELPGEEAIARNNLGEVSHALGENEQAQKYYWHALQRFLELGDRRGEGRALNDLGRIYEERAQGANRVDIKEAQSCYKQALRIFQEIGDRRQEVTVLRNLGRFSLTNPEEPEILKRYRQSMACFVLAKKISLSAEDAKIPAWIEDAISRDQAHLGAQSYEEFLQEIETRAEQIVEEMLHVD